MSEAQRSKLQAASDYIGRRKREEATPADIINGLQLNFGATVDLRRDPYKLRLAGVAASCSWSKDAGLLENWRKTATVRLMQTAAA
jgi:hypothetical protein